MKKILILLENGVEDSEFIYPYYRFQEEGFKMDIVAPEAKKEYIGKRGVPFKSDFHPAKLSWMIMMQWLFLVVMRLIACGFIQM